MRNFIIFLFTFFLFIFIANNNFVFAQTPSLSPTDQFLNSFSNCGGVNQACCTFNQPVPSNFSISGLPAPFDIIITPINALINWAANGIKGSADSITKFFIDTFKIPSNYCKEGTVATTGTAGCTCLDKRLELISRLCLMTSPQEQSSCLSCVTGGKGIWTAIGCVESDLSSFIKNTVLGWGIGLAGGLAMLCLIYSAFTMQSSQGNPEKLKKAQEMLTSCIMGLLLIIFSVFILKLIGVDILKLPGFS